jgi:circadian clock protein KaiC
MSRRNAASPSRPGTTTRFEPIPKCPTGIRGLDDITEGGLPRGRPTLVCGKAGCGKTLLAMEFIVRGARDFGEPGVFMSFEETGEELAKNVASLGFDLPSLIRRRKIAMDYVQIERSEIEETGEYDLEGLFVRLGSMIDAIGAKRVALDTVESLFSSLPNEGILRAELRRLFRWLKDKGVTAVITGEQGRDSMLTRHGLEEFVSDCVIFLDHRVSEQNATRRLRVVKYRGSAHGTNEFPTLIDEHGLSVLPISSLGLSYPVSRRFVSTGIPDLDARLGGKGYREGSSILVSGTAGTGKTSLAAAFAEGVCRRRGRCLYFAFEESPAQILRNMASVGIRLGPHVKKGLLRFEAVRPNYHGLEGHLLSLHGAVDRFRPAVVIVDPITGLGSLGNENDIRAMLTRVVGHLKNLNVTSLFTSLTGPAASAEQSEVGVSSLMDAWILIRMVESGGQRLRRLVIIKSRGMAHSGRLQELVLSRRGLRLVDVAEGLTAPVGGPGAGDEP